MVFGGYDWENQGGWNDFIKSFATIDEAKAKVKEFSTSGPYMFKDWFEIVDKETEQVIE